MEMTNNVTVTFAHAEIVFHDEFEGNVTVKDVNLDKGALGLIRHCHHRDNPALTMIAKGVKKHSGVPVHAVNQGSDQNNRAAGALVTFETHGLSEEAKLM